MRQEEKDKAIRTYEEVLKKCDDSISMWTSLMNNDVSGFSKNDCLKHISIQQRQKDLIIKLIEDLKKI